MNKFSRFLDAAKYCSKNGLSLHSIQKTGWYEFTVMPSEQTTLSEEGPKQEPDRIGDENEGYRAQAMGYTLMDNPYGADEKARHWAWRAGFIDAFRDSN
jgi:hypothetical protein